MKSLLIIKNDLVLVILSRIRWSSCSRRNVFSNFSTSASIWDTSTPGTRNNIDRSCVRHAATATATDLWKSTLNQSLIHSALKFFATHTCYHDYTSVRDYTSVTYVLCSWDGVCVEVGWDRRAVDDTSPRLFVTFSILHDPTTSACTSVPSLALSVRPRPRPQQYSRRPVPTPAPLSWGLPCHPRILWTTKIDLHVSQHQGMPCANIKGCHVQRL